MIASIPFFKLKTRTVISLIATVAIILLFSLSGAWAEEPDVQHTTFEQSIEESLQLEKGLLTDLEQDRDRIQQLEATLTLELETYKILHTTCTNMLARQRPDTEILEQAAASVKAANIRIQERMNTLNKQYDTFQPLRNGVQEQLDTNTAYLEEIKSKKNAEKVVFIQNIKALINSIQKKQQYLIQIHDFYQSWFSKLGAMQENLTSLSTRLDTGITLSRKSSRLIRRTTLFTSGGRESLKKETDYSFGQLEKLLSISFVKNEAGLMWKSVSSIIVIPLLIILLVMMLAFRLRRSYMQILERQTFTACPVFRLAWWMFNRSMLLLIITALLFTCTQVKSIYVPVHVMVLLSLLQVFLFTKWGFDFISGLDQTGGINMTPVFQKRIRVLLILIRYYIAIYIILVYMSHAGSILLSWGRLVFEVILIAWCLEFWKTDRRKPAAVALTKNGKLKKEALRLLTYVICFGGLATEVAGYGSIPFIWYLSWGRTLVIGLWAILLYAALRELSSIYQVNPDQDSELSETSGAPITWLFLKLGQPVVLLGSLMAVILAWGGKRDFLVSLLEIIQQPYQVGSLEFSIIGFVYALIVLLITHIAAQAWRYIFQQKLLVRSGMVVGLQESLTTISVYLLWGLGVLVALNFIGLNTTTLAVGFGALGIGLGFGLQNIFNNFVSGIILLLERPIQVGDDIQVNDTLARVRKINVRSTIAQTYDNASLIIPNSELISNQVTNWSFKDKRLRRNIVVGVAYGSDIELVRKTLLEVADITPRVLKQPKPDVIFKDFGDSALIFNLRIWTNVAYFLSVETEVRFTIDRLFRERNITIAFPQRDIHVFHNNPSEL